MGIPFWAAAAAATYGAYKGIQPSFKITPEEHAQSMRLREGPSQPVFNSFPFNNGSKKTAPEIPQKPLSTVAPPSIRSHIPLAPPRVALHLPSQPITPMPFNLAVEQLLQKTSAIHFG